MPQMPDRTALGRALRVLREAKHLSQEDLAHVAGLHRTYIGGIERGERNPSFESIGRILSALGSTWSALGKALDEPP
jgi:transcriptional regulator with XRE-family HTH domain